MQTGVVVQNSAVHKNYFPAPDTEVVPGVRWGQIEAFPSPAYWASQLWANTFSEAPIVYKLGASLKEEVGACLLGGHGIPASVGLAAFAHLRDSSVFEQDTFANTSSMPCFPIH